MTARSFKAFWLLFLVAGCSDSEEIQSKKVAKSKSVEAKAPTDASAPAAPEMSTGPYRILGAAFPTDNPQWFFKLTGTAAEVASVEKEVDNFLLSVRFPNGLTKPPLWDMPKDWKEGPARQMRHATLLLGPSGKLELSVSQAMGGLPANVQRWAGQVGDNSEMSKITRDITTVGGIKATRVDVTGPKNPAGAMPPFMGR